MTDSINRDQMRCAVGQRKHDRILRDRVFVRGVENGDAIDVAVVLGKPDQLAVGRDPVRVRVGGWSLKVFVGVGGGLEGSHG